MIRNRRVRILELVSRQDANHLIRGSNDLFCTEFLQARKAGSTGRFTSHSARSNLRFGIQNLLIGHLLHDTITDFNPSEDTIRLVLGTFSPDDVMVEARENSTRITLADGALTLRLLDISLDANAITFDFVP